MLAPKLRGGTRRGGATILAAALRERQMERLAVRMRNQTLALLLQELSSGLAPRGGSWPVLNRLIGLIGSNASFGLQLCFAWPEGCAGCHRRSCRPIRNPVLTQPFEAAQSRSRISWRAFSSRFAQPSSDPSPGTSRKLLRRQRPEATQPRELACQPRPPPSQPQRRTRFRKRRSPTTASPNGGRQARSPAGSARRPSAVSRSRRPLNRVSPVRQPGDSRTA